VFWRLTLPEWLAACDGYLERKGAKGAASSKMTKADLEAALEGVDDEGRLIALLEAEDAQAEPAAAGLL